MLHPLFRTPFLLLWCKFECCKLLMEISHQIYRSKTNTKSRLSLFCLLAPLCLLVVTPYLPKTINSRQGQFHAFCLYPNKMLLVYRTTREKVIFILVQRINFLNLPKPRSSTEAKTKIIQIKHKIINNKQQHKTHTTLFFTQL